MWRPGLSLRGSAITKRIPPGAKEFGRSVACTLALPTSAVRLRPDFLIVGVQRSGTTSLYNYLLRHPAVAGVRFSKGTHYFDLNATKSWAWYLAHFPTTARRFAVERQSGMELHVGEASVYYVFHPLAIARIAERLPHAKLIVMLRDPVERAYSQYQHELARGFEYLTFEKALDEEEGRLAGEEDRIRSDPGYVSHAHVHHSYVARGRYLDQIRRIESFFPPEQLLVMSSEQLFAEPVEELERVYEFLGLPHVPPPETKAYNARSYAHMPQACRERLRAAFAEPNRQLAEYLTASSRDSGRLLSAVEAWDG